MSARDLQALLAMIEARQARPFRWGTNDCVRYAGAGVAAQTGRDPLADVPRWNNRREALAITEQMGGLIAALDARFERIPLAFAQRGDIAGIEHRLFGVGLMIIEGQTLVGPGRRGNQRLRRDAMQMAWSATSRGERG
ncbi:MAG: hypothetical protein MUF47_00990 [Porphyrobacter sp.]|jgi:hypothetical protein|nr:hypothetical protein [Porphyrobacter sp.]